jgi:amino acid adenylation domain-containing protein/non-ribosomal peptide synthase protein (TIGR01720 family)
MPEINDRLNEKTGFEIAVIGMAGKFPGAKNIHEFWENLKNGVESIAFLTDEETKVNPGLLEDSNYVKCKGGVLEDIEYFDAAFFDYIPSEAEVMDPQVRFLHECAWTALEDAGYNPDDYTGAIGLYAGASANLDWEIRAVLSGKSEAVGKFTAQQLMDRDFLCTRAAYKLDLRGPAVTVQTACSTSLLAVYMGCRALISGECDMVLAGGVSISSLEKGGYFYEQGMILSRDGHCRAFDADACGTVGGAGVGIVVLKSLDEALTDKDHIYAVIKGSAINNDGCGKIGYTAPGVDGQAEVIEAALDMAEIPSDSITYIEAHGTGTVLGDPIEIEALTQAFNTDKKSFCAVGAVKANIGHLDAAAGVAGFIKTVLALKHQLIPPAVNFQAPNPKIDFENSPFYINTTLKEWKNDKYPLRAGVSSFGIGGTNAHVILEEAPVIGHSSLVIGKDGEYQLILLSARTEGALQRTRVNLANYFKKNPNVNLADAAYTLQKGRKAFEYRKMWVCENPDEAARKLMSEDMQRMTAVVSKKDENRLIVFMFPGLGAQYVNMGRELYQKEPIFQKEMDRCFKILNGLVDYDIKEILYPHSDCRGGSPCPPRPGNSPLERGASKRRGVFSPDINQLEIAQVVVFSFEYALAKLVIKWGIKPDAMIGYSFGEYTAACLAGVLSLEDALKLIVNRGRLINRVPAGSMLSVPLTAIELKPLLNKELSIAIDNGPSCVAAGPDEAIDAFETQMQKKKILCVRVQASRAIHSQMMEPICGEFRKIANTLKLSKPQIPYISNVTGDWLRAVTPGYWATHLQETVQFARGIKKLLVENKQKLLPGVQGAPWHGGPIKDGFIAEDVLDNSTCTCNLHLSPLAEKSPPGRRRQAIFIEIGPGRDLSNLMARYLDSDSDQPVINLIRDPRKNVSDVYYLLNRLGSLWLHGVKIDWTAFHAGEERYRIPLPTYSFEAQRFWMEGVPINLDQLEEEIFSKSLPLRKKPNTADWFYIPSWKRSGRTTNKELPTEAGHNYLLFIHDNCSLGEQLANRIRQKGNSVIVVKPGSNFAAEKKHSDYQIDPGENKHYEILFGDLRASGKMPDTIIHLWSLFSGDRSELNTGRLQQGLTLGFYSLLYITRSIEKQLYTNKLDIKIISTGLHEFSGDEEVYPEQSPILGLVKVIPQEYPNIRCQGIDILLPTPGSKNEHRLIRQLLTEFAKESSDTAAAYRGDHRWVQVFEPMLWEEGPIPSLLKEEGVYLVTGGLGKIGLYAAEYLAKVMKAKLVLTRRSPFPAGEDQEKILKIRELEKTGAEILILSADAANYEQMKQVIDRTYERFSRLDGVIHCAGTTRDIRKSVQQTDKAFCEKLFYPKIQGTLVLERILKELSQTGKYKAPGFCLLISSLAVVLGGLGMAAYTAAHFFIDSFVHAHYHHHDIYPPQDSHNRETRPQWFCVDLEGWNLGEENDLGIRPDETIKFFDRLFSLEGVRQVVISTGDLRKRIERWVHLETLPGKADTVKKKAASLRTRPALLEAYEAPRTPLEQKLAELWQEFFGIDKIGIHDNFFELGGDSLKGMTLVNQYRKLLGEMVYVQVVFDAPTIAELAVFFTEHFPGSVASLTGSGPGDDEDASYPKEKINTEKIALVRQLISSPPSWEPSNEPKLAPVIFILSPTRSGSTLLRVMLGGHPRLFAPPELDLLSARTLDEISGGVAGEIRAVMQLKQCSVDEAKKMMKSFEDQQITTREFYRLVQGWLNGRTLVDKSPLYAYYPGVLQRAEEEFERPYYIHLVRHPYGMIRSKEEAKLNLVQGVLKKLSVTRHEVAELEWIICHQNIVEFLKKVPSSRQYCLKFEDLVKEPRQSMEKICEFLDLEFHQGMLEPYSDRKERMTDGIHAQGIMRGDPKFHTHKTIDPGVADQWKTYFKKDFLGDITWELAESFGYERLKETGDKYKYYKYTPIELTEKKEYYTLSSAQKRLYILHQLQPEGLGYNSPRGFLLGKEIDRQRLEQVFQQLIRRHEILRTSFEIVNEEPVQRVHDNVDLKIEYFEAHETYQNNEKLLRGVQGGGFLEKSPPGRRRQRKDFLRPFDLTKAPLVRVGLVDTGDNQMVLLLDNHHIAADGMSHQVLMRDFVASYQGNSLPALQFQYKDFSSWQNHLLKSNEIKKQEGYWLNLFKDVDEIPKLDLPTDYPRPVVFSFEGDRYNFYIDEKSSLEFKNLGTGGGLTLYMSILAAFNVLLYKYTGQEDIVIGCGIAGRQHADLQEVIGMFINTLAMRNQPRGGKTYLELQSEVKENCINAFENQDFQFEELVDKLEIERNLSRNPLFDVSLAFQNFERTTVKINTDLMQPLQNQDKTSKFDITLYVIEMDSEIHFQLEYYTQLFKPATIERMAGHFLNLIRNICENPNSGIGGIDILSEEEKQLLIYDYNQTEAEYPHDKTIHELFAGQAERTPDYTALQECKDAGKHGAAHVTYHELDERSDQLAHLLIEKGVQPDTIVGIMMHRSMELVIGIMAILKAGGAYLPIDPQYPQERIQYMLTDSNVRILLKKSEIRNPKSETNPNDSNLNDQKKTAEVMVLNFEHLNFKFVSNFDIRISNLRSSNPAYIIYTSGSTGKPKGVMIEQSALVNYIWGAAKNFVKGERVNFHLYTSISFDLTVTSIFTPLITGNTIVIYDEEDRGQLTRQVVQNSRKSVIKITPSHLKLIREDKIESGSSSVRRFIVGGEALESSLAADIYDIFNGTIEIYNEYGPTEAAVGCMLYKYNHGKEPRGFVPIGKAAANYRIYLVDKQGNPVPVGIVGELLISGPGLARGYLNNPDLTAERFCLRRPGGTLFEKTAPPGPPRKNFLLEQTPGKRFYMSYRSHRSYIYKTGDLARRHPDGNIEFLGRIDQQVKIKGFRIEPAEIESRLLEKEEIKDVVVVAKEDENKEKHLCAYIVSTKELNTPELREWLSKTLPYYMVPLYMVRLESIPLTGSGKVDHKALPKADVKIADEKYNPPGNWIEEKLVEIWQEVLAIEKIGVTTNFFEIGGDSIKAIQVSARLKNYQLDLRVNDLFLHPTIRELAKYVQSPAMPDHGINAHEQGTVEGEVQLTPIQRWFFDHDFTDKHHFNHAIMLYSEKGFQETFVTKLFKKIIEHHDALRMVYKRKGTKVVQWNKGLEEPLVDLRVVDLKNRRATVLENEIEKTAHRIQRSIDLEKGPLLKLGLFKTDQGDHLLIVIYHLVVDGVSWRILFEDISRGYNQLEKGEELVFQEKTTSFRCWSQKLKEYSQSDALLNQREYWRSVEKTGIEKLPKDFAPDAKANKSGNSKVITVRLEEEHTASLLKEVNQAYGTQINDILLTAIGMALREWKGIEKPVINLEGHGRENIIAGIDVSRTVGWFTAQFPVVLDMNRWQDLSYIIKSVKETLRKIPQKGIGYGILRYLTPEDKKKTITFGIEPEISFNYLGQVDFINISGMKTGDAVSPHLERVHAVEINGIITAGKLTVTFRYNKCEFMKSTIEKLAHAFHSYLIKIITHCTGKKEKELTPADMDYSKELTIDQLEKLEDKFRDLMVEGG